MHWNFVLSTKSHVASTLLPKKATMSKQQATKLPVASTVLLVWTGLKAFNKSEASIPSPSSTLTGCSTFSRRHSTTSARWRAFTYCRYWKMWKFTITFAGDVYEPQIRCNLPLNYYFRLTALHWVNLGQPSPLWVPFLHLFRNRTSGDLWNGVLRDEWSSSHVTTSAWRAWSHPFFNRNRIPGGKVVLLSPPAPRNPALERRNKYTDPEKSACGWKFW